MNLMIVSKILIFRDVLNDVIDEYKACERPNYGEETM